MQRTLIPPCLSVARTVPEQHSNKLFDAEFVEMTSSTANEISTAEKKTTIHPEHVIAALEQLGFSEIKEVVYAFWQQTKEERGGG